MIEDAVFFLIISLSLSSSKFRLLSRLTGKKSAQNIGHVVIWLCELQYCFFLLHCCWWDYNSVLKFNAGFCISFDEIRTILTLFTSVYIVTYKLFSFDSGCERSLYVTIVLSNSALIAWYCFTDSHVWF